MLGISTFNSTTGDSVYHTIGNFTIMDQMGQMVTQDTFADKIYVANFFFVTCPGICKQMNEALEGVQKSFAGNSKVKFLSFTVNPQEDSIAALQEYARLHDAVPYQWYFLRGDKDTVFKLARQSYLAETSGYLIHSQNLTLVDSQKRIRGIYSGTVQADVNRLIVDINLLLKEGKENTK